MSRLIEPRILLGALFSALVVFLIWWLDEEYAASLRDVQYFNGWVLAAFVTGLMLLPLRKRLSGFPLGNARYWLQVHYYAGIAAFGVFLLHSQFRLPNAPIEWILWVLFCIVSISGAFGGLLSRHIPKRLEGHGGRVLFEQIEPRRAAVAGQAEQLVRDAVTSGKTRSLSDLYFNRLAGYFSRPSNLIAHLRMSDTPVRRIVGELHSLERYLDSEGRDQLSAMEQLVLAKNNLDFHRANAGLLKIWLFFHVPAAFALIAAIVVHVLISYGFSMGAA